MASRKRAVRWKKLKGWQALLLVLAVLISALISWNETLDEPFLPTWDSLFESADLTGEDAPLPTGTLKIQVIDVGNADAILLQNGDAAMLIDAGESGDGDTVLEHLRAAGVDELDVVIATHADSDHIGGMKTVLTGVPVRKYIMAFMPQGHTPTTRTYLNLLQTIDEKDIPVAEAEVGTEFALGEAIVTLLGPADSFDDNNNHSVICRVTFGRRHFLFTGDAGTKAERALLESGADLTADVLKLGHHGSSTSTSEKFLQAVDPSVALITCGEGNSYGHPHAETVSLLRERGITAYRTDLNGDITILCDGDAMDITTERGEAS